MKTFLEFLKSKAENLAASAVVGNQPNTQAVMFVGQNPIDVSIPTKQDIPKAIKNMRLVVSQILQSDQDVEAVPEDGGKKVPWGDLYNLSPKLNPNYIEIEYYKQSTRNVVGDLAYSANYVGKNPLKTLGQKMGLIRNPEAYYLSKFRDELNALNVKGRLPGWPENWKITTSRLGRNIILYPKPNVQ